MHSFFVLVIAILLTLLGSCLGRRKQTPYKPMKINSLVELMALNPEICYEYGGAVRSDKKLTSLSPDMLRRIAAYLDMPTYRKLLLTCTGIFKKLPWRPDLHFEAFKLSYQQALEIARNERRQQENNLKLKNFFQLKSLFSSSSTPAPATASSSSSSSVVVAAVPTLTSSSSVLSFISSPSSSSTNTSKKEKPEKTPKEISSILLAWLKMDFNLKFSSTTHFTQEQFDFLVKNGFTHQATKIFVSLSNSKDPIIPFDPCSHDNFALDLTVKEGLKKFAEMLLVDGRIDPSLTINGNNLFSKACKMGWYDIIVKLLKVKRVDPSQNQNEAFRLACLGSGPTDDTTIVQLLLNDRRVNPADRRNEAFIIACERGAYKMMMLLLKDARVNPSDMDDLAFRQACQHGHTALVRHLLTLKSVKPTAKNNEAIRTSCLLGRVEVVKILLKIPEVDPNIKHNFIDCKGDMKKKKEGETQSSNPLTGKLSYCEYTSALENAAMVGSDEIVKLLLLDSRVDPSANHNFALVAAVEEGWTSTAKLLLSDKRIDPSIRENELLYNACRVGNGVITACLFKHPKFVLRAEEVRKCYLVAVNCGHVDVVKAFLEDGRVPFELTGNEDYASSARLAVLLLFPEIGDLIEEKAKAVKNEKFLLECKRAALLGQLRHQKSSYFNCSCGNHTEMQLICEELERVIETCGMETKEEIDRYTRILECASGHSPTAGTNTTPNAPHSPLTVTRPTPLDATALRDEDKIRALETRSLRVLNRSTAAAKDREHLLRMAGISHHHRTISSPGGEDEDTATLVGDGQSDTELDVVDLTDVGTPSSSPTTPALENEVDVPLPSKVEVTPPAAVVVEEKKAEEIPEVQAALPPSPSKPRKRRPKKHFMEEEMFWVYGYTLVTQKKKKKKTKVGGVGSIPPPAPLPLPAVITPPPTPTVVTKVKTISKSTVSTSTSTENALEYQDEEDEDMTIGELTIVNAFEDDALFSKAITFIICSVIFFTILSEVFKFSVATPDYQGGFYYELRQMLRGPDGEDGFAVQFARFDQEEREAFHRPSSSYSFQRRYMF